MSQSGGTGAVSLQVLPLDEHIRVVEESGLETLLCCMNAWALRHRFVNRETGVTVHARCGSWSCLFCGPRKVDMWRQLVKAAEPTLFITLTQVGKTLQEAARVLTTVLQYLRRGSKGRGINHVGVRPAYPLEVFAILEEHSDFEHVGFHWHLLVKGVDFLPNQVVSDALRSATKGRSYITKTERVRNGRAVGYVTKYLMKAIDHERRGTIEETREVKVATRDAVAGSVNEQGHAYEFRVRLDDQGLVVEEGQVHTLERLCKAHRIRYSKHFFPEKTVDLRRRLFGGNDETDKVQEAQETHTGEDQDGRESSEPEEEAQAATVQRSSWTLLEVEPAIDDAAVYERRRVAALHGGDLSTEEDESSREAYRRWRREVLCESLTALREGKRLYSRRVIGIWSYQREQLRSAG